MLTIWPSFSLLLFFLVVFLECRTIGGRVTLPLGSFLMVFCYGAIGAPLLALLLQQIPIFPDAGPASPITWLIGPPVEELAKALPVIVLAFLTREARRLSIADLTLIGFASGAGFGFVEGNLSALVNGTLPSLQHFAVFGLQSQADAIFFAGHPVSTALVGLAAGIGLRFLPPSFAYAWAPATVVILWTSFDHGIYNWKVLNAANGVLPQAHFATEFLHLATLNGQLQTWLLPVGLITAQFFEALLCSKAVGARRDFMLAREWRLWVINEWFVALMRAPLGRAAFAQTLAYFRLRRAFYLATYEAARDPKNITLTRHVRSLEDRLRRERSILFDPPQGTWLLPLPVFKAYAAQWTWRMRWVLIFAVLLLFLFMLDPSGLPDWLRQILFGQTFTIAVVVAGILFAAWRIVVFARLPRPDPLAAEGAACAGYYTRALLLGCAFVCGTFPTLTLLLGWKAVGPGAAFITGYLPGWIAQGGNLQTLLGLGAIGAAVAPDPRPAGEALRHEIAAADDRMQKLGSDIAAKIGAPDSGGALPAPVPHVDLDGFLDTMAKLDDERAAQARRQLALDECARLAAESTIKDPSAAVESIKDEFERLAAELLESAAKELDAIAALEETYGRAWVEIMQDLDAHDTLRRRLKTPLRVAWQTQNEIDWALDAVKAEDECLLPMQLTLLPELDALTTTAHSERAILVVKGIERIRATAEQYGDTDPFAFAVGTNSDDEDETALLAEFASGAHAEAPKPFGHRTAQPDPERAAPAEEESAPLPEATPPAPEPRAPHYQDALDQLIDTTKRDQAYLDTIRQVELAQEPAEPTIEPPAPKIEAAEIRADARETTPVVAPTQFPAGDVEDLIDAIKRDSGYLALATEPQTPTHDVHADESVAPAQATSVPDNEPAPAAQDVVEPVVDTPLHVAPDIEETETTVSVAALDTVEDAATSDAAPEVAHDVAPEVAETPADVAEDVRETETAPVAEELDALEKAPILESAPVQVAAPATDDEVHQVVSESMAAEPYEEEVVDLDLASGIEERVVEPAQAAIEYLDLDDLAATPRALHDPVRRQEDFSVEIVARHPDDLLVVESGVSLPSDTPHEDVAPPDAFEQEPTEPTASETIASATAETPVAIPRWLVEKPETSPAPEQPPARTAARSSFYTRLLRSLRSQSDEPHRAEQPAKRVLPAEAEQTPVPKPVEQIINSAPSVQTEFVLETKTPEAPWLADLGSSATDGEPAQLDGPELEPIEWPAPKLLVDIQFNADAVSPIEVKVAVESPVNKEPLASLDIAPSVETVIDEVAAAEHEAPADQRIEHASAGAASEAPEVTLELSPVEASVAGPEPAATETTPEATPSASVQVDEFSSKADRLTYLLAKLEGAIQAKAAAEAAARTENIATEAAPVVEPEPATPAAPEPAPQITSDDERDTPFVETAAPDVLKTSTAPVEALAPEVEPSAARSATPAAFAFEPTNIPPERQVKPDRLSYLLTKLFETAKEQPSEPTPTPRITAEPEAPATPVSTEAEAHADDVLDLRVADTGQPEPDDDTHEIEHDVPTPVEARAAVAQPAPVEAPKPQPPSEPVAAVSAPEAPAPAAAVAPPAEALSMPAPQEESIRVEPEAPVAATLAAEPAPAPRPRRSDAPLFGTRRKLPTSPASKPAQKPARDEKPAIGDEPEPITLQPAMDVSRTDEPATMPRRDWKLGTNPNADDLGTTKKSETSLRLKTGSGALATVDAPPPGMPVAAEKAPAKYYGPKLAQSGDEDAGVPSAAQQRGLSLSDALAEYYAKTGQQQPPMHTTDRATLARINASGKLEAPRRRGAPWSNSGMPRRGEVVLRLKPGAEQFVEFVPSKELFGQVPHYYPRGVGKGNFETYVPAAHLEYFDIAMRQWAPVQRGSE